MPDQFPSPDQVQDARHLITHAANFRHLPEACWLDLQQTAWAVLASDARRRARPRHLIVITAAGHPGDAA